MSTTKMQKAMKALLISQKRMREERAISSTSRCDCSVSGCQFQVMDMTDFGVPFLRTCRRNGTCVRWGQRYCKQHAAKARKPVCYGKKPNAGVDRQKEAKQ